MTNFEKVGIYENFWPRIKRISQNYLRKKLISLE